MNGRVKNPQFHAMLSCKGGELTHEQLKDNAIEIMDRLGYSENPILIYSHSDTKNNHVHIVTSRIGPDGKKIDHNLEGKRANKILTEILKIDTSENFKNDMDTALAYNFSTVAQFYLLMEDRSYDVKEIDHQTIFFKHGKRQGEIDRNTLDQQITSNKELVKSPEQIKGIIRKYAAEYPTVLRMEKRPVYSTAEPRHESELTIFLKEKFGYDFVFFTGKTENVKPFGYAIIDHKNKTVYKGSEVIRLDLLIGLSDKIQKTNLPNKPAYQVQEKENALFKNADERDADSNAKGNSVAIGNLKDLAETLLEGNKDIYQGARETPKRRKKRKNNFF